MERKNKNEKKSVKAKSKQSLILIGGFFVIGLLCGILMISFADSLHKDDIALGKYICEIFIMFLEMYAAFFLQIILHEAGHLLFGLMTGYRFSSFRIGSFMLIKNEHRMKVKRLSIAGTGGQCLMVPPNWSESNYPYVLYNLGGVIVNVIAAILSILLFLPLKDHKFVAVFLLIMAVVGIVYAFLNGFPMRLGMVDNDGHNAKSLGKDQEALHTFWLQMKINDAMSRGVRLKDMPEEWFYIPDEKGLKNSMTVCIAVFTCNRRMDEKKIEEAYQIITKLLESDSAMIDLHRNLLICDEIYCEMVGANRIERIEELYKKELKSFLKTMKNFPSVLRTEYTYALLVEKNQEKAVKIKVTFDKIAKKYPYPTDIQSERELMELTDLKYSG